MQNWVNKRNEKIEEYDIGQKFFDTKTGQKLFRPLISKTSNEYIFHRKDINLYDYLYEDKKTRIENQDFLHKNSLKEKKENSNSKLISQNSEQINLLLKEDCFANLFEVFDHNNNNILECTDSFIKNAEEKLDKNVLQIVYPILLELKE